MLTEKIKDIGENMTIDIKMIEQTAENALGASIDNIRQIENVTNNTVYAFEAADRRYIIKLYRSRDWPENGKIPFVYHTLSQNSIPHAELIAFSRENKNIPNGYLIEGAVRGVAADKIHFDRQQECKLYIKLAEQVSRIHVIPIRNFGYIGDGEADYDSILSFFEEEFDERTSDLLEMKLFSESELMNMKAVFLDVLDQFNDLPPVLCHGDLSKKNIMVQESGDITLIDWDDAMSYNWMADVSRLTFWMKMNYSKEEYGLFRNIFLEHYQTDKRKAEYSTFEKAFHLYIALDSLVYFLSIGDKIMGRNIRNYLDSLSGQK